MINHEVKVSIGCRVTPERKDELLRLAEEGGFNSLSQYLEQLIASKSDRHRKVMDHKSSALEDSILSKNDLAYIEERFSDGLNTALNFQRREFKSEFGAMQIVFNLMKAAGLDLTNEEDVLETKSFLQSEFTLDDLLEFFGLEDNGYNVDLDKLLPMQFNPEVKELIMEYFAWMIDNGKATNPETLLLGNLITYLKTGIKSFGNNAEETDLFLERMIEVGGGFHRK